ncbi:hypothetical protein [Campylobacter felis]|uniref:hypothetical protein n=1 Tax=Campylobacter felis TaxID=2974565 RepID=UPI002563995F|nr:hypothetical protein [Campylobacter felis]
MEYFLLFLTLMPISLLPGFNMLLAFSLELSLGYKATLWVIVGQFGRTCFGCWNLHFELKFSITI